MNKNGVNCLQLTPFGCGDLDWIQTIIIYTIPYYGLDFK